MNKSNQTNKILSTMYKEGKIDKNQISYSQLHSLFDDNYIANSSDYHDNNVYLTDKGRAYVEELPPQTLFKKLIGWVEDNTLEIIAIIISIIALLKP